MQRTLKEIGIKSLGLVSRLLIRLGILDKQIIVRIDGGICSQMHFYLIGRWFAEKGIKVKYSIDWFDENGWDLNKQFVRSFDLLKAFPELVFEPSSRIERLLYKPFRYTDSVNWTKVSAPCYLCGYYHFPEITAFLTRYFKVDISVLDQQNSRARKSILSRHNSVAVHVRRGDLSIYVPAYGEPSSDDYFRRAVNYFQARFEDCYFYFFSDEPQYVKDHLIAYLELSDNYSVMDFNDSAKGYMDLLLVASCNHQITSQGSLGLVGAALNNYPNKIIACRDDDRCRAFFSVDSSNVVFIEQ